MSIDIWNFNPLATDHLNGLTDPGTPPGFEDVYGEEVFTLAFDSSGDSGARGGIKLYFATNFLVYALKARSDISTQTNMLSGGCNVKLTDVDGVAINNVRVRLEMLFGTGEFPKPLFCPLWVPMGQFLLLDIENEYGSPVNIQLVFCGFRRTQVHQ